MDRNKEACTCKNVTYGMVEDALKAGATTYDEVQEATGFGTGCGKCKEFRNGFDADLFLLFEKVGLQYEPINHIIRTLFGNIFGRKSTIN